MNKVKSENSEVVYRGMKVEVVVCLCLEVQGLLGSEGAGTDQRCDLGKGNLAFEKSRTTERTAVGEKIKQTAGEEEEEHQPSPRIEVSLQDDYPMIPFSKCITTHSHR